MQGLNSKQSQKDHLYRLSSSVGIRRHLPRWGRLTIIHVFACSRKSHKIYSYGSDSRDACPYKFVGICLQDRSRIVRRKWRCDIGSTKALPYLPNHLSVRHPERSGEILLTVVSRTKQPPRSRTIFQSRKGEKWRTSGSPTSEGSLKRFDVKLTRIYSNIHLKGYIKPHYRSRKPS